MPFHVTAPNLLTQRSDVQGTQLFWNTILARGNWCYRWNCRGFSRVKGELGGGTGGTGRVVSTTRFHLMVTPKQHQNPCSNTGNTSSTRQHNVGRQEKSRTASRWPRRSFPTLLPASLP